MTQATTKAPGLDKINFQILQMIWGGDKIYITNMVYYAIQLGYHTVKEKKTWEILLKKQGKWDFRLVQSYRIISLLNFMGKIVGKVVAKELFQYCDKYLKLYTEKIGGRSKKLAINKLATMIYKYQEK